MAGAGESQKRKNDEVLEAMLVHHSIGRMYRMVQEPYYGVQARNLTGYEFAQLTNPVRRDLVACEVVSLPPSLQEPNKKTRLEFPSTLWNNEACTYSPLSSILSQMV